MGVAKVVKTTKAMAVGVKGTDAEPLARATLFHLCHEDRKFLRKFLKLCRVQRSGFHLFSQFDVLFLQLERDLQKLFPGKRGEVDAILYFRLCARAFSFSDNSGGGSRVSGSELGILLRE